MLADSNSGNDVATDITDPVDCRRVFDTKKIKHQSGVITLYSKRFRSMGTIELEYDLFGLIVTSDYLNRFKDKIFRLIRSHYREWGGKDIDRCKDRQ